MFLRKYHGKISKIWWEFWQFARQAIYGQISILQLYLTIYILLNQINEIPTTTKNQTVFLRDPKSKAYSHYYSET